MTQATPPRLGEDNRALQTLQREYARGTHIEPHVHAWAQVLYAVQGVMWVEIEHEALVVPPQRAVWLPAGLSHSIKMMSAVRMRNLYLRPHDVAELSQHGEVFEVSPLLRQLIVVMAEEGDQRSEAYCEAAYRLIVLELLGAKRSALRIALPTGADRRLETVCRAVIGNPTQDISLEHYAEHAGASVRTLSRLFQQELGMGFAEWRRQVQLAVATSRLSEGHAINAIARSLGYLPSSFSDMFRRELGAAPAAYVPPAGGADS
ncbi:helix-turn-helix transcriptional regulator [Dyella flava]|uniref:Helix-turn-helix transcriptional regulator n=1 Tax=Dyella flava TaxID=1920170 RepID=A0ABS2K4T9_9GAMM|nr:helix-turn-helix transcriptional regulator [Dyella flava]MBM7125695.1 helix-turn-helix transcriptional regulator [Dyella flava]GLQ48789.1 transcriptional regulator [Dyella flava]